MPYCIILRSRTDARVTGWYSGRNRRWPTDRQRQIRFDNPDDASAICQELRSLCLFPLPAFIKKKGTGIEPMPFVALWLR
jgi:hypothetical protein